MRALKILRTVAVVGWLTALGGPMASSAQEAPDGDAEADAEAVRAQRLRLDLAYRDLAEGQVTTARAALEEVATGPDAVLAGQARRQLAFLPRHFWADLYVDSYGWTRAAGGAQVTDLVPTVRVRAHYRPQVSVDVQLYAFAQATRDAASRGRDAMGLPELYADNYALFGAGFLVRLAGGRVGLFAQAGPAVNLLDDGRPRLVPDVRAGAAFGDQAPGCRPDAISGAQLVLLPCLEGYGEAVYVFRFDNNVIGFGRGRAGATWLLTGPVAWQVLAEGRSAVDVNGDFWNNFLDGGLGLRWRLLRPVPVDLFAGAFGGRYFGRHGVDPVPSPPWYADLRVVASTYVEF